MYSDKVMLHFMNPHNMGEIENPSGVGVVGNPVCGDLMQIQIKVEDGILTDVKFKTGGWLNGKKRVAKKKSGAKKGARRRRTA